MANEITEVAPAQKSKVRLVLGWLLAAYGVVTNSATVRLLDWYDDWSGRWEILATAADALKGAVLMIAPQEEVLRVGIPILAMVVGIILLFRDDLRFWKRKPAEAKHSPPQVVPNVPLASDPLPVAPEPPRPQWTDSASGRTYEMGEYNSRDPAFERTREEFLESVERSAELLKGPLGMTAQGILKRGLAGKEMPKPKYDVPLKDVLCRIAFESEWAVTREWDSPGDQWQKTMWEKPLAKELLRPLASGDIRARGVKSTKQGDEHGHSYIPKKYWRNPKLTVDADRLLLEPKFGHVFDFENGVMYHDILFRRSDVDEIWPSRPAIDIAARPSPFVAWADEWKACYAEQEANSALEYEMLRERAVREARAESEAKRRAKEGDENDGRS